MGNIRASRHTVGARQTPSIPARNFTFRTTRLTRAISRPTFTSSSYRAASRIAGWKGPPNHCNVYGNKDVGEKFNAMLKMGTSKPWPKALAAFSGEHDIDATVIAEYFAPLSTWLDEQNKGKMCT